MVNYYIVLMNIHMNTIPNDLLTFRQHLFIICDNVYLRVLTGLQLVGINFHV